MAIVFGWLSQLNVDTLFWTAPFTMFERNGVIKFELTRRNSPGFFITLETIYVFLEEKRYPVQDAE